MRKKVIIFGGDGFCGWPTALHLSNKGYDVTIIDNLSRRCIDIELEVESLTLIRPIHERLIAWNDVTKKTIDFINLDIAKEYDRLVQVLGKINPDTVVHFAEQRAAPYSMKSSFHKRYTVDNNISATHNILAAIVELDLKTHVVHLGTMGVYGYGTAGVKIPEGYLNIEVVGDNKKRIKQEILYPANPGSVYHMTKTLDQLIFAYYNKNDRVRVTDLHQGVVWGTQTKETKLDERLINRFDYDGDYGTVLNRFLMQAVIKYPLTVHGTGGQTRAFIHIQDTVRCIEIAIKNPPKIGDRVEIFNQMTQTHRVRDLAQLISEKTGAKIHFINNPRNEDNENELFVKNDKFLNHGLKPITLEDGLLDEIMDVVEKHKDRCDKKKIICTSYWTKKQKSRKK